jgi:hypothetical protein
MVSKLVAMTEKPLSEDDEKSFFLRTRELTLLRAQCRAYNELDLAGSNK